MAARGRYATVSRHTRNRGIGTRPLDARRRDPAARGDRRRVAAPGAAAPGATPTAPPDTLAAMPAAGTLAVFALAELYLALGAVAVLTGGRDR